MSRYYNDFSDSHDESLEHYGILGMKWGVRRYVNEDGSLTAKGREKYGKDPFSMKPKYQKYQAQQYLKSKRYQQANQQYHKRQQKVTEDYEKAHEGSLRSIKKRQSEAQKAEEELSVELMKDGTKSFSEAKATDAFKRADDAYGRLYQEQREYNKGLFDLGDKVYQEYAQTELTALGYSNTGYVGQSYINKLMNNATWPEHNRANTRRQYGHW